eukprot:753053-Hanusia_phi.AAC.1
MPHPLVRLGPDDLAEEMLRLSVAVEDTVLRSLRGTSKGGRGHEGRAVRSGERQRTIQREMVRSRRGRRYGEQERKE